MGITFEHSRRKAFYKFPHVYSKVILNSNYLTLVLNICKSDLLLLFTCVLSTPQHKGM